MRKETIEIIKPEITKSRLKTECINLMKIGYKGEKAKYLESG